MFLASFKPEWQILTNPPIWIPSEWIHAQAGDTTKEIALWNVKNPEGKERAGVHDRHAALHHGRGY